MRKLVCFAIIAALFFVPLNRVEIGKVLPIKAVAVYKEGNKIVLELDTGYKGSGTDVYAAYENLKESTPAIVYPDTAEFLILEESVTDLGNVMQAMFKKRVKVFIYDAKGCVGEVAEYLSVHGEITNLHDRETK